MPQVFYLLYIAARQHVGAIGFVIGGVVAASLSIPVLAEPEGAFLGLEAEMTDADRRATGVEALSPAQRQALDAWLRRRFATGPSPGPASTAAESPAVIGAAEAIPSPTATVTDAPEVTPSSPAARAAIEAEVERRVAAEVAAARAADKAVEDDEPFEASLDASFTGWSGKTVFRLDNGQVWRQRSSTRYRHRGDDRRVRFTQNLLGGWEMEVLSTGRTVVVRRVR